MAYFDDMNSTGVPKSPKGLDDTLTGGTSSSTGSGYGAMTGMKPPRVPSMSRKDPMNGGTIQTTMGSAPAPSGPASPPPAMSGSTPSTPASTAPPPNYDGYAAPGYQAPNYTYNFGKLGAWDETKFNDAAHQTPKYVLGRILSNYADTPQGLTQAMGDIQRAYAGSQLLDAGKSGKVFVPGVGIVDVGVSFGSGGGHGWAWNLVDDFSTPIQPTPPSQPAPPPTAPPPMQGTVPAMANAGTAPLAPTRVPPIPPLPPLQPLPSLPSVNSSQPIMPAVPPAPAGTWGTPGAPSRTDSQSTSYLNSLSNARILELLRRFSERR